MDAPTPASPDGAAPVARVGPLRRHKFLTSVAGLAIAVGAVSVPGGEENAEAGDGSGTRAANTADASSDAESSSLPDASSPSDDSPLTLSADEKNPPKNDVELGAVTTEYGMSTLPVTITNNSPKTSDYWIRVEFADRDGGRAAEGVASESSVAPGRKAASDASPDGDVPQNGKVRITSVERTASAGN